MIGQPWFLKTSLSTGKHTGFNLPITTQKNNHPRFSSRHITQNKNLAGLAAKT